MGAAAGLPVARTSRKRPAEQLSSRAKTGSRGRAGDHDGFLRIRKMEDGLHGPKGPSGFANISHIDTACRSLIHRYPATRPYKFIPKTGTLSPAMSYQWKQGWRSHHPESTNDGLLSQNSLAAVMVSSRFLSVAIR